MEVGAHCASAEGGAARRARELARGALSLTASLPYVFWLPRPTLRSDRLARAQKKPLTAFAIRG